MYSTLCKEHSVNSSFNILIPTALEFTVLSISFFCSTEDVKSVKSDVKADCTQCTIGSLY